MELAGVVRLPTYQLALPLTPRLPPAAVCGRAHRHDYMRLSPVHIIETQQVDPLRRQSCVDPQDVVVPPLAA